MVLTLVGAIAFDSLAARRREHRRATVTVPDVEEQEPTVVAPAQVDEPAAVVPEAAPAPEAEPEPEPEAEPENVETNEADPVSSPTGASHIQPQDFARSEERVRLAVAAAGAGRPRPRRRVPHHPSWVARRSRLPGRATPSARPVSSRG